MAIEPDPEVVTRVRVLKSMPDLYPAQPGDVVGIVNLDDTQLIAESIVERCDEPIRVQALGIGIGVGGATGQTRNTSASRDGVENTSVSSAGNE